MNSLILLVIAMGVVTYLPRMLPMVFLKNMKLPAKVRRFLQFVPYAVLASLIFPGILSSVNNVYLAVVGGVVSVVLALFGLNVIIVVLGGIISVFIAQLI